MLEQPTRHSLADERTKRRLAAIAVADVVGYSRLMEADEAGTLAALMDRRKNILVPVVRTHGGRVVKVMGDGVLVEFASAVNAVKAALELQVRMAEANEPLPEKLRIVLRIGINLGDVIGEGSDVYGDGVNIAARLETLAEPGGVCISGKVHDEVIGKIDAAFEDGGDRELKNIEKLVRIYRTRVRTPMLTVPFASSSARPSIAVLPFTNMSGDPEQEYFADGLVEDLITNLSKMPGFFVIARNSTFAYKAGGVDVRKVAADLGVRYVMEGSVRKSANRLRITGQLIEGTSGNHVWAEKFEGSLEDIFDLQDRLTESIVGALEPTLRRVEIERARTKRPEMLDAYDFYLRALPHGFDNTIAENDEAIRLLDEALRLDPNYAVAHAHAAWCHEQRWFRGGFNPEDRTAALKHAALAINLGAEDAQALSIAAFVEANITHDYDSSIRTLGRALEMNPNSALAFGFSALALALSERYELAVEHGQRALRLSPNDPLNYHPHFALSLTYLFTGRLLEAVQHSTLTNQAKPNFSVPYTILVTALVNLNRLDAAREIAARLLSFFPDFTIDSLVRADYWRPHLMENISVALRKVGLPE